MMIKFTTLKHINKKRGTWDGYYILMNDSGFELIENSPLKICNCKGCPYISELIVWAVFDLFGWNFFRFKAWMIVHKNKWVHKPIVYRGKKDV